MIPGRFSLFLSLIFIVGLTQAKPSVEIIEIYGEVSMQIGEFCQLLCGLICCLHYQ